MYKLQSTEDSSTPTVTLITKSETPIITAGDFAHSYTIGWLVLLIRPPPLYNVDILPIPDNTNIEYTSTELIEQCYPYI